MWKMNTRKGTLLTFLLLIHLVNAGVEICPKCGKPIKEESAEYYEFAKSVAKPAVICGSVVGGIAYGVTALGFGPAGVVAGSLAATYQATLGGVVGAGSAFSALQSIGAAGLSLSTKLGITGACTSLVKTYDSFVGNDSEEEEIFCECSA